MTLMGFRSELATLQDDHPVWDICAHYLAAQCASLVQMCSPERIVLSGGVMQRQCLFPMIRDKVRKFGIMYKYMFTLVAKVHSSCSSRMSS